MNRPSYIIRGGICAALLLLSACEDLPDWLGGSEDKKPLPGTRVAVLSDVGHPRADDALATLNVDVPSPTNNDSWPQENGAPAVLTGNLALSGFSHHDEVKIGDHNGWERPLYASPIVAGGSVFAMDAKGYITAHEALHIDNVRWTNKSLVDADENDTLGGGLAWEDGKLFATSGRGQVVAIDAQSGKELWKQSLGLPLRVAPKVAAGKLYLLTEDNQLFVLETSRGSTLWTHRGMNESAGFLASVTPAIGENIVVVPYSSGGLHALDVASGQEFWNDTLLRLRHTFATSGFAGIGGSPIIDNDVVYAIGSSGFAAAIALSNGRHIWEEEITSINTPWLAGDFLYIVSTDNELICLMRSSGRIRWVKQLPRYEDEEKHKHPLVWRGPVMAGGGLLVAGMNGQMLVLSPKDGSTISTVEIPEKITDAPIVAGGRLYVITQDAKLHSFY